MVTEHNISGLVAATHVVDSAVGVSARWYIAVVKHRSEKRVAERLAAAGIEHYLPLQDEVHVWRNGRRARVERVVIPAIIFIHCTERERRHTVVQLPYINRFMTDRAGTPGAGGQRPLATVPDSQISRLRFMVGASDQPVNFTEHFVRGQQVRVVRGPFRGLTGQVQTDTDGHSSRLYINIDGLGAASVAISPVDVEPE